MGGFPDDALLDHALSLARGTRVLYVPTANREDTGPVVFWYDRLRARGTMTHLNFFPWPPAGLRELTLSQDVILIAGGNTANALAIWRLHGFDEILREAWQEGILLSGWSAGMICWFEHGVTDSFGPDLAPMDCLGFLPGSACPHYDGEAERRTVYQRLVTEGFPPGLAADDCVALRFEGTELAEVASAREGSRAYRVTPGGEEPIEPRLLG